MAKYMFRSTHTVEGLKGLLKEGGTARREAVAKAAEVFGGTLEGFYYAFGDTDVFTIVDLPDNVSATASSLVVGAAGTVATQITVLITPEEVDQAIELAAEKGAAYRPPGQ